MNAFAIEEAERLIRIAKADHAACAALLVATGVRFANAAFHGQQAVEKALKAVLISKGIDPGRTHNLVALHGQLREYGNEVPVGDAQLALINPYAVTLRYDDIEVELIPPEALRRTIEVIIDWADSRVLAAKRCP